MSKQKRSLAQSSRAFGRRDNSTPGGRSRSLFPPPLFAYLRKLQGDYRPPGLPLPRRGEELAEEARRHVFNGDHLVLLLTGLRGPWQDAAGPAVVNLFFVRTQIQNMSALAQQNYATRASRGRRNRQIGKIKSGVKALHFNREERRQEILKLLDAEKLPLPTVSRRLPRIGITKNAAGPESKHAFWKPIAGQLVRYLERSCTGASEKKCCEIAAKILHLASAGAFPDGARGAAGVKQRYYRSL